LGEGGVGGVVLGVDRRLQERESLDADAGCGGV
jgi:hypothetical protein